MNLGFLENLIKNREMNDNKGAISLPYAVFVPPARLRILWPIAGHPTVLGVSNGSTVSTVKNTAGTASSHRAKGEAHDCS